MMAKMVVIELNWEHEVIMEELKITIEKLQKECTQAFKDSCDGLDEFKDGFAQGMQYCIDEVSKLLS